MSEVLGGAGALVIVGGEPGIGKTRFAEEVAARAAAAGARVLWARCRETGGAPAFWPWVQVLRGLVSTFAAGELGEARESVVRYLGLIVPELAPVTDETAPPPPLAALDSEHARFELFDAIASFLASAARPRPLALILDDVHAADVPSLLLLQHLAERLRDVPLLVVTTHREAELRRRPDARLIFADLARAALTLRLRGLDDSGVHEALAAMLGVEIPGCAVAEIQALTGGNPFLIEEVVEMLTGEEAHGVAASAPTPTLPARARELIRHRLSLLSDGCREVLRTASLIGQEFDLPTLAAVCRLSEGEAIDLLGEAIDDGLLVVGDAAGSAYRFRHALVRETLCADLAPAARRALHCAIGEAIEAIHHPHVEPHLGELSHHFVQALPAGSWQRAARYAAAAGDRALAVLAYEDAAAHYEASLAALDFAGTPELERRCEALLSLGTCRLKAAELDAARQVFTRAAALARTLGRSDLLGRAALGFAPWSAYGKTDDSGAALLEEALAAQPATDGPLRAQLLARLAHVLEGEGIRGPRERVLPLSRAATRMARRLGEPRTLARALFVGRWVDWDPASYVERVAMTEEMAALAEQLNDRELAVMAEGWRVVDRFEAGDPVGGDTTVARHAALARTLRQPEHQWWSLVWMATRAILQGRLQDGEELSAQALAIGERVERDNAALVSYVQLSQVQIERGQLEPTLALLEALVADRREILDNEAVVICRRAQFLAELGRLTEARHLFEQLAGDGFAGLPRDMRYPVNLASLALVCAALGDTQRAALLYERLAPATGRNLMLGPFLSSAGPADRYQGLLAATMGRFDAARQHFEDALALGRRMGWVPLVVRTQCDYARVLLSTGDAQARAAAEARLDEAVESAERLGMNLVAEHARLLRSGGGRPRSAVERSVAREPAVPPASAGVHASGSSAPPAEDESPQASSAVNVWRRDGDDWAITYERVPCRLRHSRGLRYLAELLRMPGREVHVLELVATMQPHATEPIGLSDDGLAVRGADDADALLDPRARGEYRERLREIDADLAAAEADNDPSRAARLRAERETLEDELLAATGLAGRARRSASAAERARINVTRAITRAIARVDAANPQLGRHLMRRVRTGAFCAYLPDPRVAVSWTVVT